MSDTLVDPRVSRAKFDREVAQYREFQDEYIRRGWWLTKAEFPTVLVVFGTNKGPVKAVVFGAVIDFTNYDLWPASVRLVDPFTMAPYKASELPYPLLRRVAAAGPGVPTGPTAGIPAIPTGPTSPTSQESPAAQGGAHSPGAAPARPDVEAQAIAQAWDPAEVPFICLPGVREYHDNPAHTGDSWLLHRGRGEGTLHFILDQLYKYGVQPLRLGVQVQAKFVFQPEEIPA